MTVKINICNVLDMPKYAVSHNKMKLQTLESPSYFNFIQAHTVETRKTYRYYFSNYLQFNQIKESDVLLQTIHTQFAVRHMLCISSRLKVKVALKPEAH